MRDETLHVYIGIEPGQWLISELLRFSITRRTQAPIEFHALNHLPPALKVRDPGFTLYRFAVPELAQYCGRALYLDADTLVLCDLLELFEMEMQGYGALARRMHSEDPAGGRYTSVMLLDCAQLTHWKLSDWEPKLQQNRQLYQETIHAGPSGLATKDFGDLPTAFNQIDSYDQHTKILHFAELLSQPWKHTGHAHNSVFLKELKVAVETDEIPQDSILREINAGHIYPLILQEMGKA